LETGLSKELSDAASYVKIGVHKISSFENSTAQLE